MVTNTECLGPEKSCAFHCLPVLKLSDQIKEHRAGPSYRAIRFDVNTTARLSIQDEQPINP